MHHYQSLGGWTFVFADYYSDNITLFFTEPSFQKLADLIDPYCLLLY